MKRPSAGAAGPDPSLRARDAEPGPMVIGISAPSGTGKTTLIAALIPRLKAAGLAVGVIKRAHHDFDIDHPGKDSHTVREAGADRVLVASARRWALVCETHDAGPPAIPDLVARLDPADLDLVLCEGYGLDELPRVVVHRRAVPESKPVGFSGVLAVCTDDPALDTGALPRFALDDADAIAAFLRECRRAGATTRISP